jgi:hypothetical protein
MQPAVMMISVYVLPLPQFEPVALVNGNSSAAMAAVVGYVFVGPSIKKVVVMWWEDAPRKSTGGQACRTNATGPPR